MEKGLVEYIENHLKYKLLKLFDEIKKHPEIKNISCIYGIINKDIAEYEIIADKLDYNIQKIQKSSEKRKYTNKIYDVINNELFPFLYKLKEHFTKISNHKAFLVLKIKIEAFINFLDVFLPSIHDIIKRSETAAKLAAGFSEHLSSFKLGTQNAWGNISNKFSNPQNKKNVNKYSNMLKNNQIKPPALNTGGSKKKKSKKDKRLGKYKHKNHTHKTKKTLLKCNKIK